MFAINEFCLGRGRLKLPAISIIIPVYNAEKYLRKCLDSVVQQTFSDIEVICVNDCSTDGSLSILREYEKKDSRVKVIHCEQNNRQAVARNIGMSAAAGKYIAFMDADDWIDLDRFERLYREAEKENADIVFSGCVCEYENGCVKYVVALTEQKRLLDGCLMAEEVISEKVSAGAPWHGIARAALLKDNGLQFQSIRSEDYVFNMEAYTRARTVCLLPECDYHFRALEQSGSRGAIAPNALWTVKGLEAEVDYLQNNNYLRGIISNYNDFVDKKTISEFCGIIINESSITSSRTFGEKCLVLRSVWENCVLQKALRNGTAFQSLRSKQQLLVSALRRGHFSFVVLGLSLRELLKREYYRIKNCAYRVFMPKNAR